jgi:hypothetical protein
VTRASWSDAADEQTLKKSQRARLARAPDASAARASAR